MRSRRKGVRREGQQYSAQNTRQLTARFISQLSVNVLNDSILNEL